MNRPATTALILLIGFMLSAQGDPGFGKVVSVDQKSIDRLIQKSVNNEQLSIELPLPDGSAETFSLTKSRIAKDQPADIRTYRGKSLLSGTNLHLTLTPSGMHGAIQYKGGYYFLDPIEKSMDKYLLYSINEAPQGICGVESSWEETSKILNNVSKSVAPFPIGTQLRTYRMAAAATGEMTAALSNSQSDARDKIVAIMNAANLIYELEAAISFELIPKTITSMDIIFTNGASDPFAVDPNFANAGYAQSGFNTMNSNSTLLYNEYDIGHVFHISSGGGIGASGQAGPGPCTDAQKARAWTQFTSGAIPPQYVGFITGLFVHEVGHQFSAWHTYNANAPAFCSQGWSSTASVEPGSGSTLMGYGGNCSSPTNYVLTSPNNESYFHTKSLEQIYNSVASHSGCITTSATGNTPPSANAGTDVIIPKGTPFLLTGSATDPNVGDNLSYVWDQFDVATSNDKGAFGNSVNGAGGYTAVNSTDSAPLFRSRMSTTTPIRFFPALPFILDGTNNPPDNEGEDLPQMGRNMTFRFTVRDNAQNGGGVDSDDIEVTVNGGAGPLQVSSQNSGEEMNAGDQITVTWDVNNTNTISSNVKISLSTDGGISFAHVLNASTLNDGSEIVTLPGVTSSIARIKVSSLHHPTAEFFDINNVNLNILPAGITCNTYNSSDVPKTTVSNSTVTSILNIPDDVTITDVDLLNITGMHTYMGDLVFSIVHPDNTTVAITNSNGGWGCDDFNFNVDDEASSGISACSNYQSGTYQPTGSLSSFDGKNAAGSWTLRVQDVFSGDEGVLNGWSMRVCSISPCAITGVTASTATCSGNNATFSITSFYAPNGSGNYEVVNASNQVVGTGTNAPITVTINGPTNAGDQQFRVRDAGDNTCISAPVTVSIPSCPECSITGVTAGTAICNGQDATFEITAFTAIAGSGSYEVINNSDQVVGAGNSAPIAVIISGPTSAANQDFRVRDANNTSCISTAVTVAIPECLLPCTTTSGASISGNLSSDTFMTKTYLISDAMIMSGTVKFQANDSLVFGPNFEVMSGSEFQAQIGDCDESP